MAELWPSPAQILYVCLQVAEVTGHQARDWLTEMVNVCSSPGRERRSVLGTMSPNNVPVAGNQHAFPL